jgi:hypothetical protein
MKTIMMITAVIAVLMVTATTAAYAQIAQMIPQPQQQNQNQTQTQHVTAECIAGTTNGACELAELILADGTQMIITIDSSILYNPGNASSMESTPNTQTQTQRTSSDNDNDNDNGDTSGDQLDLSNCEENADGKLSCES